MPADLISDKDYGTASWLFSVLLPFRFAATYRRQHFFALYELLVNYSRTNYNNSHFIESTAQQHKLSLGVRF